MPKTNISAKIEQDVKKEIKRMAKQEKRTESNMIEVLIDMGIKKYKESRK
ncbi:ribbon-helix-helix protein, CopG family [candidate division KSB1 bacterium]